MPKANEASGRTHWNAIDWQRAEKIVRNLRQRIFRASREGKYRKVKNLQKLLLRSQANVHLSVRRVTQENAGKNTPGVDKLVVKTPKARAALVEQIIAQPMKRALPVRRVYIPKRNGKKRPLGIPTVVDRVRQAMVKNALEPEWEARFEANSNGFRPGRGCHDAIEGCYGFSRGCTRKKWVVDADIKGAFDHIDHNVLLKLLEQFPAKGLIQKWLQAGYMEEKAWKPTESGTPQGGIISPLLANIALHGMGEALGLKYKPQGRSIGKRGLVRYADDFVIFCESKEDAERAKEDTNQWVATRGLSLSEEKTRIVQLTDGFDFLGFTVRQYRTSRNQSGWKLLITPSKKAVNRFREKLRKEWRSLQGHSVRSIITRLNPILRGWANYYRTAVSKEVFGKLDDWMFHRCFRHIKRTHPKKSWAWRKSKYFGQLRYGSKDKWVFGDKESKAHLLKLSWTKIKRHIRVKGNASPDDAALREYWNKRQRRECEELPPKWKSLAQSQKGICPQCKGYILNGEELQIHHVRLRSQGGKEEKKNLRLTHLYCHQQIHKGKSNREVK